jgi:type VII secretion-associated serine protease mycosin
VKWRRPTLAIVVGVLAVMPPATPASADEVRNLQWHLRFLNVAAAQQISQGESIIVAVIDTGVDASHPDLSGNVLPGVDFVDSGGNGQQDADGHGTDMAGVIAAHGRGGAGALGIAPKSKILPVRTVRGSSGFANSDVEGFFWAIEHGAKVICYASGGSDTPQLRQTIAKAQAADIVVVAAAGNRPGNSKVAFPAAYSGVLAAAGVDQSGNHADISVTGPELVLAAPAVDIVSTSPGGRYRKGTGTSDATAILAGAAALVRAKYPNLSAEEVIHRLTATAIDKGPQGRDSEYGYGVVDLVGALTKDVPPLKPSATPSVAPTTSPPAAANPSSPKDGKTPIALIVALVGLLIAAGAIGLVIAARRRTPG